MKEPETQDTVLPEEEKRSQGKFLYALILSDREHEFGTIGLVGGRVYSILYRDIAAVVSDYPVREIRFLRKNLSPYHLTIRTVAGEHTTIPAKFGQVAANANRVRGILQANYDEIRQELARLQGKVEMGLKISWNVENIFEYLVEKNHELRRQRDQLLSRFSSLTRQQQIDAGSLVYDKLNEMRGKITEKAIGMLQDSFEEVEFNQVTEAKVVMHCAFLIRKDRQEDFSVATERIAVLLGENYAIKVDGPWVPFSFVKRVELFEILNEEGGAREEKPHGARGKAA